MPIKIQSDLPVKEILEQDIRGTVRIVIPYDPKVDMLIPSWLRSAS